ncbi:hypothetical protein C7S18_20045 [Ahniella affigens]|uniref:Conjugal transfer protein TraN n=1 Tax=Ahniella affigens TaxID=2021234 RepID=A0A2P1PWW1_9GAMM|nr:conjugal transfer protein TraN [Ahniella affigens]AVP99320.1 hypothetical protein C7S18_20045 [Ahniella affigens]
MLRESIKYDAPWRGMAWLLLALGSTATHADDLQDTAVAGQDFAHALIQQADTPSFSPEGEREQGSVQIGDQVIPVNQLTPGGDRGVQDRLQALEGDEAGLRQAGEHHLAHQSEDSSAAAQSLRVVTGTPKTRPADFWLAEHETLAHSALALSNPASVAPDFPACTPVTTVTPGTQTYQRPHTRICERVHRPDQCVRTQTLIDASNADWQPVTDTIRVTGIDTRTYDLRERIDPDIQPVGITLAATGDLDVVVVSLIVAPSPENNWTATVQLEATDGACVSGCDVQLRLHGGLRAVRQVVTSDPPNCLLDEDAFCRADFSCEQTVLPVLAGTPMQSAEAQAIPPLYPPDQRHQPEDPRWPVCTTARARYHCEIQSGSFCTDGPKGQHCVDQTDDSVLADTCAPLVQAMPQCELQASHCTEGAMADSQWCYVESVQYNCPETMTVPSATVTTTQPCAGQIRCAGHDCLDTRDQESSLADLADGMAGMMIAQTFTSDWQAPDTRSADTSQAPGRIFPGRAYECRKALGGSISCCDETETDIEAEWFARYQRHIRRSQARDAAARYADQGAHGSWKTLAEQDQHALADIQKPLTSGPETVTAGQDGSLNPDPGSSVGASRELSEMNAEFIADKRYEYLDDTGYACSVQELDLAIQRELGHCLPVGSYCERHVLGACLDKRDVYCCFNSVASAEIRASIARDAPEATTPFGTPRDPNCSGLLIEAARPKSVALPNIKAHLAAASLIPDASNLLAQSSSEQLTGTGSELADGARPTTQDRTAYRMAQIDGAKVRDDLFAETSAQVPILSATDAPGQIAFAPAFVQTTANRPLFAQVLREGKGGAVSVAVQVTRVQDLQGAALPVAAVSLSADTISWADHEAGIKTIIVQLPAGFVGSIELQLDHPSGGAVLYPNDRAELRVMPN